VGGDHGGDPGEGGPEGPSPQAWLGRRASTGLRSRALQGTQHRRALFQQAQGAVATGYDKRERIYQGTIDVASIRIWLRDPVT
jgi:hypothetical protein